MKTTLNIQQGKSYRLRNGLITGALAKESNGTNYMFTASVNDPSHATPSVMCWLKDGHYLTSTVEHRFDIIEEIQ